MAGPLDLFNLAAALRDEVAFALDTLPDHDPTLLGAPERQIVSPGVAVDDFVGSDCCSQISVWALPTTEGDTTPGGADAGMRSSRFAWINYVGLTARVTRCIPQGEQTSSGLYMPPSVDELTDAAQQHLADGWALWNLLHEAAHAKRLVDLCDEIFFDGIVPLIPSGGCAGWQLALRATLGGYTEELGS